MCSSGQLSITVYLPISSVRVGPSMTKYGVRVGPSMTMYGVPS